MASAVLASTLFLLQCAGPVAFTSVMPDRRRRLTLAGENTGIRPHRDHHAASIGRGLFASLTPIGPFCPFRSSAAVENDPRMERLSMATPEVATEMDRIQLDLSTGATPDPDRLLRVADQLSEAVDAWENLNARLRISTDFQTREYAKLTQAHLSDHGTSVDAVASMMRWQAGCMKAMATNTVPPMPPSDMDLEKLMQQQAATTADESSQQRPPSITGMSAAMQITSTPFTGDEPAFESETVKEEYAALCRDHMSLIDFGAKYDTFDPLGKIGYLDEIEKIEERWDVFYARFSLMGMLNEEFSSQCEKFLSSMGLDERKFRNMLKRCHQLMRDDAEAERQY